MNGGHNEGTVIKQVF